MPGASLRLGSVRAGCAGLFRAGSSSGPGALCGPGRVAARTDGPPLDPAHRLALLRRGAGPRVAPAARIDRPEPQVRGSLEPGVRPGSPPRPQSASRRRCGAFPPPMALTDRSMRAGLPSCTGAVICRVGKHISRAGGSEGIIHLNSPGGRRLGPSGIRPPLSCAQPPSEVAASTESGPGCTRADSEPLAAADDCQPDPSRIDSDRFNSDRVDSDRVDSDRVDSDRVDSDRVSPI